METLNSTSNIGIGEVLKLRQIPLNESFICMFSDNNNHTSLFHEQTNMV